MLGCNRQFIKSFVFYDDCGNQGSSIVQTVCVVTESHCTELSNSSPVQLVWSFYVEIVTECVTPLLSQSE